MISAISVPGLVIQMHTALRKESEKFDRVFNLPSRRMPLDEEVEKAIAACMKEGILTEFLEKNRMETKRMSIYEYDEERHMRQTREEGAEEERERLNRLILLLAGQNRMDDIVKSASDPEFQKGLFEEFNL